MKGPTGTDWCNEMAASRAVVRYSVDDEVLPLQARIEDVADAPDLEEVYNTERHLLYVACSPTRDFLSVSDVNPASEFLDDFNPVPRGRHP
jgi:hypothetical protein